MSRRIAALAIAQGLVAVVVAAAFPDGASALGVRPEVVAVGGCGFGIIGSLTMHIELRRHAHAVTIVEAALVAALFHLHPMEVVAAAMAGELLACVVRRQRVLQLAFNVTAAAATTSLAAAVFTALPGGDPLDARSWPSAFLAAGCYGVASHTSTSAVLAIVERRRFRHLFTLSFAPSAVATGVSASIGVLVVMQAAINLAAVLVVAPIVAVMVHETQRLAAHRADHLRFKRLYAASARTGRLVTQFEAMATLADEARSLVTGAAAVCCATDRTGRWHGIVVGDEGNRLASDQEVEAALRLRDAAPSGELTGDGVPRLLSRLAAPVESLVFAASAEGAAAPLVIAVARQLPGSRDEARAEVLTAFAGHAALTLANAALYADVEDALAHEVDLNRQKDDFVAAVSHELRTPLTSMIGSVASIRRLGEKLTPDKQSMLIEVALRQGARLKQLIEDLLLLSSIEGAPKVSRDIDEVDLAAMATDVASELGGPRPDAPAVAITFHAGELPPVRTDEGKLRQIVTNLVENARKYAPDSDIEIVAGAAAGVVTVDVIDHGEGISPADRDRVFERFTQLDQSATRAKGGTGLGLYLCRRLAGVLGGSLELSEAPGGGCRFTLTILADVTTIDLQASEADRSEPCTLVHA